MTNQVHPVLQGPYITNTYGGGIQCQGPTVNFTPYVTGAVSAQKPYEGYYDTPVYDMRDIDEDGAPDNLNQFYGCNQLELVKKIITIFL